MTIKFLQILTFYDQYLQNFYQCHSQLISASFSEQVQQLIRDGFGGGHIFSPYLQKLGYDAQLIIANNHVKQSRWLIENGVQLQDPNQWFFEVVRHQIEHFKPNILYLSDPISFDSKFINWLSWKPDLIIGWRAAPISDTTDWSCFDILLSSSSACLNIAKKLGARSCRYFHPGFPKFIADDVAGQCADWDVVFSGQWSDLHSHRNAYLQSVAKAPLLGKGDFSIGYFLSSDTRNLPAGVAMHNQGSRWGIEMYRSLRSGRICLNAAIDMANSEAPNMRLFEATGVGTFLLNAAQSKLNNFFEVGTEIETFSHESELIEKINYYLENPKERETIAKRAQKRCLADYSMERRAAELDEIISSSIKRSNTSAMITGSPGNPPNQVLCRNILNNPNHKESYLLLANLLEHQGITDSAKRAIDIGEKIRSKENDKGLTESIPFDLASSSTKNTSLDILSNLEMHFPNVNFGSTVQIIGLRNILIGEGSCVGDDAWLNVVLRDGITRLKLGKCVLVGRRSTLSSSGYLEIADYCLLAPNVYISNANHEYINNLRKPIVLGGTTQNGSTVIEENCWLGINSVVSGSLTIGRGSVIGANTTVLSSIPPFSVAVGNPCRIVKMYDPISQSWESVKMQEDMDRILENRRLSLLPSREEYAKILSNSGLKEIDPITAGRAECLL